MSVSSTVTDLRFGKPFDPGKNSLNLIRLLLASLVLFAHTYFFHYRASARVPPAAVLSGGLRDHLRTGCRKLVRHRTAGAPSHASGDGPQR